MFPAWTFGKNYFEPGLILFPIRKLAPTNLSVPTRYSCACFQQNKTIWKLTSILLFFRLRSLVDFAPTFPSLFVMIFRRHHRTFRTYKYDLMAFLSFPIGVSWQWKVEKKFFNSLYWCWLINGTEVALVSVKRHEFLEFTFMKPNENPAGV